MTIKLPENLSNLLNWYEEHIDGECGYRIHIAKPNVITTLTVTAPDKSEDSVEIRNVVWRLHDVTTGNYIFGINDGSFEYLIPSDFLFEPSISGKMKLVSATYDEVIEVLKGRLKDNYYEKDTSVGETEQ